MTPRRPSRERQLASFKRLLLKRVARVHAEAVCEAKRDYKYMAFVLGIEPDERAVRRIGGGR